MYVYLVCVNQNFNYFTCERMHMHTHSKHRNCIHCIQYMLTHSRARAIIERKCSWAGIFAHNLNGNIRDLLFPEVGHQSKIKSKGPKGVLEV